MTWRVIPGDCRTVLPTLPAESVQTCITSPPYWGLRDYGHADQLGLERTPEEYVARMVEVFRDVRRVLRPDGTLWLNLGDTYSGAGGYSPDAPSNRAGSKQSTQPHALADIRGESGLRAKNLIGIPWRVAFALQADGWWLRSDIVWSKPNPMPESVTDRPTKAHEYLFLLAKSERYFYDADAIRETSITADPRRPYMSKGTKILDGRDRWKGGEPRDGEDFQARNRRTVWTISTKPFAGAHFAVMPWDLVEPCVLAGSSERGQCAACGSPYVRVVNRIPARVEAGGDYGHGAGRNDGGRSRFRGGGTETLDWKPSCGCGAASIPQTVLDPFAGAGTVGMVALRHGRSFVGIDLNPSYAEMACERIHADAPLLNRQVDADGGAR